MAGTTETQAFQAEVQQLLDLVVHSLYSHPEIFLRELISNASDALDKRRFEGIRKPELLPEGELEIRLEPDPEARTLAVHDNGIGMSRKEVVENLGTIARSGTQQFLKLAARRKDGQLPPELIGQFGVGFYSSFMVAEEVRVLTRRAGQTKATLWVSRGGGFSVESAERAEAGTSVTLKLRPADEEEGRRDFADPVVVRDVVKRHSDYVAWPIRLLEPPGEGGAREGAIINSRSAPWTRPFDEITEEEHAEFYKHVAHDWNDPLDVVPVRVEGTLEARALLYVPSKAPLDLMLTGGRQRGLQLHVKRVLVMDDCEELLPDWLRFVRGVVDSEDLSLNVSREMLQQDRQVRAIRKFLVKKLVEAFEKMRDDEPEKHRTLWAEFGAVLKEGLVSPTEEHRDRLLALLLAPSSREADEPTTLSGYVERMKDDQEAIWFMTGPSREAIEGSPHIEAFRERGIEVLYLTDPIDEIWTQVPPEFQGRPLRSAVRGEAELGAGDEKEADREEREKHEQELQPLIEALEKHLADEVKDVRVSRRLTHSPACLVGEAGDVSPAVAEMMRRMGQDVPRPKRILELNAGHSLMPRLRDLAEKDPDGSDLRDAAHLLHGQAILAEGGRLDDPAGFARLVATLMESSLGER